MPRLQQERSVEGGVAKRPGLLVSLFLFVFFSFVMKCVYIVTFCCCFFIDMAFICESRMIELTFMEDVGNIMVMKKRKKKI